MAVMQIARTRLLGNAATTDLGMGVGTFKFGVKAGWLTKLACLLFLCPYARPVGATEISPQKAGDPSRRVSTVAERWGQLASPVFFNFKNVDGPTHDVRSIAQDGDGFLWIGTWGDGLYRWDGYRMRHYTSVAPRESDRVPDNAIQALHTDERGSLWVGTGAGGVARYDRTRDAFVNYVPGQDSGPAYPSVNSIAGGDGAIWLATGSGDNTGSLDRIDLRTGKFRHYFQGDGADNLPANSVRAVMRSRDGTLWIGTHFGLVRKLPGADRFEPLAIGIADGVRPFVYSLFEASDGRIWVGTRHKGVFIVDRQSLSVTQLCRPAAASTICPLWIVAFAEPQPGLIWIATGSQGIISYQAETGRLREIGHDARIPTSLPSNAVNTLFKDRAGQIWVGSVAGLSRYDSSGGGALTLFSNNPGGAKSNSIEVTAIHGDRSGRIWLGYADGEADVIDADYASVSSRKVTDGYIYAIDDGPGRDSFLATATGVHRYDSVRSRFEHVNVAPRAPRAEVATLLADGLGLWAGGADGLWRISDTQRQQLRATRLAASSALTDQASTVLLADGQDTLWVGTQNGLNRLDIRSQSVERILSSTSDENPLSIGYVTSLLIDPQGRLWVGTLGGGIAILVGRDAQGRPRFHRLTTSQGLPHNSVRKLLQHGDRTIWASTSDGLAKIDSQTLSVQALGGADGVAIRYYTANSGFATQEGVLLFGGTGGVTAIIPERVSRWTYVPPLVITQLKVGGVEIAPGGINARTSPSPIRITPEANSLFVEFSALDYSAPEKNRYKYILQGYDNQWTTADADRRVAAYTNLPPGNYQLRILGSNRDGVWSDRDLTMSIDVLPVWYRTWWAYIGYALGLACAFFVLSNWRVKRLAARAARLECAIAERTAQLEVARAKAEEATHAKSMFLANMSHEIRTPMNAVLGFAKLGLTLPHHAKATDYFQKIDKAGRSLLVIIDDVLDLSKMEAGKLTIETVPFLLSEVLDQIVDMVSLKAEEKGLKLSLEVSSNAPDCLMGDPHRLGQILLNLVNNALKFTHTGFVRIKVREHGAENDVGQGKTRLLFSVEDSGIGMTESQCDRLFQPFSQADISTTRMFGGTGLGLAISQRLVHQMGGELSVRSQLSVGSEFYFSLPFSLADAEGCAPASQAFLGVESEELGMLQLAPDSPESMGRVLVVDDNSANQELVFELLAAAGIAADIASTGAEAVEKVRVTKYDVVLMDVQMPGMDGFEAGRRIASISSPSPPIVALTANAAKGYKEECLARGMSDYLAKPFDPRHLFRVLSRWIPALSSDRIPMASPVQRGKRNSISGIDLADALYRANGNKQLVDRLLVLFYRQYSAEPNFVEQAIAASNWDDVRQSLHKMAGFAGNIGAIRLHAAAAALEAGIVEGRCIDELLQVFTAALKEVLAGVKPLFQNSAAGDQNYPPEQLAAADERQQ